VLIFDGAQVVSWGVQGVVSGTIGRLRLVNGAAPSLSGLSPGPVTLTIAGDAGADPDLEVPAGTTLVTLGSTKPTIMLGPGATGAVAGEVIMNSQLLVSDPGALQFLNGAWFTSDVSPAVHVFGTTSLNSVVFQAGAVYEQSGGQDPFGAVAPASVVTFEPGSLYLYRQGSDPSVSGRTYGDFEIDPQGSFSANLTGSQALVVGDLRVLDGSLTLRLPTVRIRGDVVVATGGDLSFASTSAQSVILDGAVPQFVSGEPFFGSNSNLIIENPSGVTFEDEPDIYGKLTLDGGDLTLGAPPGFFAFSGELQLIDGLLHPGAQTFTLTAGAVVTGGSSGSHVVGTVRREFSASVTASSASFPIGDATTYAPVLLQIPSISTGGFLSASTSAGDHASIGSSDLDAAMTVNRTWTITNTGMVFAPCAATFTFDPADLDPNTPTGGLVVRKFDAPSTWSTTVTGTRTATSTQATGITSFSDFQLGFLPWELTGTGFSNSGLHNGSADWGDWDNDGDLDLIVTDAHNLGAFVYRNLGGAFSYVNFVGVLPAVWGGSVLWGDYDGDGLVDVAVAGVTSPFPSGTTFDGRIFLNELGGQDLLENTNNDAMPPGVGDFEWVDFDNDGDLDLALLGNVSPNIRLSVLRNDAGTFHDAGILKPAAGSSLAAADYDRDGDMDLLASGTPGGILYRNQGGEFTDVLAGLPAFASAVWGDFDNDGWPDIAMARTVTGLMLSIYRSEPANPGNPADPNRIFVLAHETPGFPTLRVIVAGDCDNDGRLDITGVGSGHLEWTKIFRNEGGWSFSIVETGGPQVSRGTVTLGDYDSDGDLDLYFIGLDVNTDAWCRILLNHLAPPNTIPTAPTGLSAEFSDATLTLHWNAATDAETPSPGLSYNIRLGTTPGGSELMAGMADPVSGYRRVVRHGNAGQGLSWSIRRDSWPDGGPLYFGVQAIDAAFAGSPWGTIAVTGVEGAPELPRVAALQTPAPTPFTGATRIAFDLPAAGRVRLEVFDVRGRLVRALHDDEFPAGRHTSLWNGEDESGRRLGAGIYFVRMYAPGVQQSRRVVLLP